MTNSHINDTDEEKHLHAAGRTVEKVYDCIRCGIFMNRDLVIMPIEDTVELKRTNACQTEGDKQDDRELGNGYDHQNNQQRHTF